MSTGPSIEIRTQRRDDFLDFLRGGMGTPLPSPKGEPHTPSGIHARRWCIFHQKNCCMKHGPKHKRGKILKGPKTKKGSR